jgi:CubicO group peptidase (beta-lactamase class C family)
MRDTTFHPAPGQVKRLATSYKKNAAGELEETVIHILLGGVKYPPPYSIPFPAGGLFSTAVDLSRFYQMMLRGGEAHGRRYLSDESFKEMTRIQTGDLKTGFVDGMGFGFGWGVVREPHGVTAMLSAGTFGHGGAYGTQAWLDPANDRFYLLMVQRANFPNSDASDLRRVFQETAAAASGVK